MLIAKTVGGQFLYLYMLHTEYSYPSSIEKNKHYEIFQSFEVPNQRLLGLLHRPAEFDKIYQKMD